MKLSELIEAITPEMQEASMWPVAVLTRDRTRPKSDESSIVRLPIFDVDLDHEDQEIKLLTDEDAPDQRLPTQGFTLEQLFAKLKTLLPRCANYSVFSGSAYAPLDDEYEGRYCAPLVGVARNREEEVFGFLQWPQKQWDETA